MKRCSLFLSEPGDLYRDTFVLGHSVAGQTWSKQSSAFLRKWGVQDWPDWAAPGAGRGSYKLYVKECLDQRCYGVCKREAERHTQPIDYADICGVVGQDLGRGMALGLPWHSLVLQRSLSRMRADLICFGNLQGRKSNAKRQRCIYCDTPCISLTFHVMCRCEKWAELRNLFWNTSGGQVPESLAQQVRSIFCIGPGQSGYAIVLAWAGSLDRDAKLYWGSES